MTGPRSLGGGGLDCLRKKGFMLEVDGAGLVTASGLVTGGCTARDRDDDCKPR